MRTEPCAWDDCQNIGECDGRNCLEAPGMVRLSLEEIADAEAAKLATRNAREQELKDRIVDKAIKFCDMSYPYVNLGRSVNALLKFREENP